MSSTPLQREIRRPRDVSETFTLTFAFIREQIGKLSSAIFFFAGPLFVLAGLGWGLYTTEMTVSAQTLGLPSTNIYTQLTILAIFGFLGFAVMAGVVNEYVALYLEKGNDFTMDDIRRALWKDKWIIIFHPFAVLFTVALGTVAFLLPGVYLLSNLVIALPIQIHEREEFGESFRRSFQLSRKQWLPTFILLNAMSVIAAFLATVAFIPYFIMLAETAGSAWESPQIMPEDYFGLVLAASAGAAVAMMLWASVFLAVTMHYFNLLERKEAAILKNRIALIGTPYRPEESMEESY